MFLVGLPLKLKLNWKSLLVMKWLLVCLIISTIYKSELKARLIKPILKLPFRNLEELTKTDIPIYLAETTPLRDYITVIFFLQFFFNLHLIN